MIRRRLVTLVPTVLGVVTLVFLLVHLVPGDPVDVMLGETANPADKAALRAELGLDRPLAEQYLGYLAGVARGDLGRSILYRRPVAELLAARIPATLELSAAALAVALILAVPLGVAAARRKDTAVDRGSLVASLLGVSIPNFWLGPLLVLAFSVHLRWFPVSGRAGWASLVLPAVTLGTALAAMLTRMLRSSLVEVLGAEYLTAARARGVGEGRVLWVHALRNALLPVITVLGLQMGSLLSGAVVTEAVFSWPGLGTLLLQAIHGRDYPLVQGCVLVISLGYVGVNLLADWAYRWADPRVRG
ncbi:nickel ABC transporter permease [Deferrisoma camini]|uniref:nickel ABC transporter permease n=1 Tax=Deferrisoma camini TaxID=1035120 RepID=UPI00046CDBB5|nr:nickel ABC transporter permease [Deferrisoma camini]